MLAPWAAAAYFRRLLEPHAVRRLQALVRGWLVRRQRRPLRRVHLRLRGSGSNAPSATEACEPSRSVTTCYVLTGMWEDVIRVNGVVRDDLETYTAKRRRLAEEVEGRSRRQQPSKQRRRYCPAPAHCDVAQTDDDVAQLQQMARAVQLSRLFKGVVRAAGVLALFMAKSSTAPVRLILPDRLALSMPLFLPSDGVWQKQGVGTHLPRP